MVRDSDLQHRDIAPVVFKYDFSLNSDNTARLELNGIRKEIEENLLEPSFVKFEHLVVLGHALDVKLDAEVLVL